MSKVKNEKSDVKIDDNNQSFVKNRGSFHPAEKDLKEKASRDAYEQEHREKQA